MQFESEPVNEVLLEGSHERLLPYLQLLLCSIRAGRSGQRPYGPQSLELFPIWSSYRKSLWTTGLGEYFFKALIGNSLFGLRNTGLPYLQTPKQLLKAMIGEGGVPNFHYGNDEHAGTWVNSHLKALNVLNPYGMHFKVTAKRNDDYEDDLFT